MLMGSREGKGGGRENGRGGGGLGGRKGPKETFKDGKRLKRKFRRSRKMEKED